MSPELRSHLRVLVFQLRPQKERLEPELFAFSEALQLPSSSLVPVDLCRVHPPAGILDRVQGVIVAGSPLSADVDVPSVRAMREMLVTAQERRMPVFGVCFGAQFLARTFGGTVRVDAKEAAEHGTFEVDLTVAGTSDPLFAGLPSTLSVQQAHNDCISDLPGNAVMLAEGRRCRVQAFRFQGTSTYGVQFHPERTRDAYARLLQERLQRGECRKKTEVIQRTLGESPHAPTVLERFVDLLLAR